jgi:hypothetical protein
LLGRDLFQWIFPAKLDVFRGVVTAVLEMQLVLNSLLMFWYRWLREEAETPAKGASHDQKLLRLLLEKADGIQLYRSTDALLMTVFAHLVAVSGTKSHLISRARNRRNQSGIQCSFSTK